MASGQRWQIYDWDVQVHGDATHALWLECLPDRFHTTRRHLTALLNRVGYSKNFVAVDNITRQLIGFCATYTTYIDNRDTFLVGSIGALFVKPVARRRGIGSALHAHAVHQLRRHKVSRIVLGSSFPRLLYGLLLGTGVEGWFARRGWRIDGSQAPGCGQEAYDWLLDFRNWNVDGLVSSGLMLRPCEPGELDRVLLYVVAESSRRHRSGWYDQYCQLAAPKDIPNILLALAGNEIVASAIVCVPHRPTNVNDNLPWTFKLGGDVGGITCICVKDEMPGTHTRDSVMIRFLNYCVITLKELGMRKMFLDGVIGGYEGYQDIGFQKLTGYRDVWFNT